MGREESASGTLSAETIRAWQRGEESAVRAVFDAYYPRAVRLATLSGLTLDEAQDCAQDAIVRAFEQRRQLRDPQAFSLWFHRIATRSMLDMLRLGRHAREVELDAAADLPEDWQRRQPPQPDEQALLAELRQALWAEVQALPPRARIALALRYDGDFSLRDIAAMLGMREGALRVTVHRALAHLRERIVSDAATREPQATRCEAPSDAKAARASHAND
jgi:RNA polymerase sigma-70 factor (ECF subfamily)